MVETTFNIFDVIVLTILGLSALFSFYRGFVREFLSLFTWIGALVVTVYAFPHISELLKEHMDNELVINLIAGLGTYLTALIVLSIFTSMISKFVKSGKEVGMFDNVLGLIFGSLRGLFIVALGFLGITMAFDEKGYPDYIKEAMTRPYVEKAALILVTLAPEYINKSMSGIEVAKEVAKENAKAQQENTGDNPNGYQWESMDKLQQMINEKSQEAAE